MKPITAKEKKVLELISQGYSTSRIAVALDISPNTVESHRKNLFAKFDVKNAPELILKAIQAKAIIIK